LNFDSTGALLDLTSVSFQGALFFPVNVQYTIGMKWLIGFGVIIIGFLMVLKSEWLYQNVGRVEWAERHLGTEGGSRLFYKLLGIAAILLTFFAWTDILGGTLRAIFSPLSGVK